MRTTFLQFLKSSFLQSVNPSILAMVAMFLAVSTVEAQRPLTASQKARQQIVRQKYTEAQQYADKQKADNYAGQYITVKWPRIEAAVGKVEETIEFFSLAKEDEKTSMPYYELLLVRSSQKRPEASIGDAYSEFLFDATTGKLIFYYNTHNNWWADEEVKMEKRCYFNVDGSFSSGSVKLTPRNGGNAYYPDELQDIDGMDAQREMYRYNNAFDAVANFTME